MEHSTCTLDISSDEETQRRIRDERGKENVPPMDDISQSQARLPRASRERKQKIVDENAIDIDRAPLGRLEAEDFYADGCCAKDVVLVVDEEDNHDAAEKSESAFQFTVEAQVKGKGKAVDVGSLMLKNDALAPAQAALFSPLEKAEEGFEVWESGSAKGDE